MNWSKLKFNNRNAIQDLCDYLREKHHINSPIFFQKNEIMMLGKKFEKVDHHDVLDWLASKHDIHLNMTTSITGDVIKLDFYFSFVENGVLYNTPRHQDLVSYEKVFIEACKVGVKAVEKRLKAIK